MTTKTGIIIADDHPIFREGVRTMINTENSFTVLAEAENGKAALDLIIQHRPSIAVLDIDMPEMNGFEIVRAIRKKELPIEIIMLTMYCDERLFQSAVSLGIKGYVLKDSARADIIKALKAVSAGRSFFSPELSSVIMDRFNDIEKARNTNQGLDSLSATQRRVLKLISEEKTSKEIAAILCISPRTVETHRAKIALKLNLHGSMALVKYAIQHKLKI